MVAAEFRKSVDLSGRASVWLSSLAYCYSVTKRRDEAFRVLRELERMYARREALGQDLAKVYAGLQEKDLAFAWLDKDLEHRGGRLPLLTTDYSYEARAPTDATLTSSGVWDYNRKSMPYRRK